MNTNTLTVAGCISFPPNLTREQQHSTNRKQLISLLHSCKNINHVPPIHAKIIRTNHLQDPFVVFELLRVCSNLKSIDYAAKIFSYNQNSNVYHYTALIDGYVLSGCYSDGVDLYNKMASACVVPDRYVIVSVLKACAFLLALREGRQIHSQVLKLGFGSDRSIRLKLIEVYGKCGVFDDAKRLFDEMPERDVVAYTVMMDCYFDHGLVREANEIFGLIGVKDTVSWTVMIDGLVHNGEMNKALQVFREMQRMNVRPNEVTIVCVLSACAQMGALQLGKWVHSYAVKCKIELNHFVGGALINMYSRCGDIDEAQEVFEKMKEKNVVTYNTMIMGFALNGKSGEAIDLFRRMIKQGYQPTNITFVAVLNACSHGGLAVLAFEIFESMAAVYGIEPQIEHYGCMVDLLGRLGRLEEAYDLMKKSKQPPDDIMLGALLSACKIHGDIELGRQIADTLMACQCADSATYVLLSNVYSSAGKWKEAAEVRAKMKGEGIQKEPGCSSIEVNNEIHEFFLGDLRHPQKSTIYKKLKELNRTLRSKGYTPSTELVLHEIEDSEKEWALAIHSEKLAICYGLISTPPSTTIRVVNNLRVCNDCHAWILLASKLTNRKIVLRDRNRFHHFENGACSCGNYW